MIFLHLLYLVGGFVFLIKGADFFVASSSSIARRLKISPLIIGLTLVALGTSLPELAVSFTASIVARMEGTTADIAMGNVIGSNIANLTLILGVTAIIMPITIKKTMRKREFPFLMISTIVLAVLAFFFQSDAQITWWEALILLIVFAYYLYLMIKVGKAEENEDESEEIQILNTKKTILLLLIGLAGVVLGGIFVTKGAEYLAVEILTSAFSMSTTRATTLVGLSVVALGTSLPELVTSAVAAKKGEADIAIGNVVGSNLFNILLILGLSGLVVPLGLNADVLIDTVILIGITALVVLFGLTKNQISKREGFLLTSIYFAYITYIILRSLGLF